MDTTRATDFFIAGCPKCGTTALFEYLASHPGAFIPPCKEPNHFCSDLNIPGARTQGEYAALFTAAAPQALRGDASAMYLYSAVAVQRISGHNPAAKVIVMLRHPVEAARSLYGARRSYGHENAPDFERAWRLQSERLEGRRVPPRWPEPKTLQYGAIYRYAPQVRRLLSQLPRQQTLFLVYEEFFAEPARQFAQVLDFLKLPPDPNRTAFPRINATPPARPHWLRRLLAGPPGKLTTPAGAVRPALREPFGRELEDYFASDVAETEALLGRKLWALPPAARVP